MRMMSSLGRIDQHKVRTGKLSDEDWPRLTSAVGILSEAPIYIDDTPGLTPTELRARARRLSREHGLGLIVIDYLQLMQVHGSSENRATEISEISRSLKSLAKELNVPVIALSQLSRAPEQRTTDQRPRLSDLRESGAIEQDADLVLFLYKEKPSEDRKPETGAGTVEVIVGKNRNGPTDKILLTWLGNFMRFEDFDPRFATV
jgi:replicative DNA helicase